MPRGFNEYPERWERPQKYDFTEHAERNAIYNLARRQLKNTIAICTGPLAISDFRALASLGVAEVYAPLSELPLFEEQQGLLMLQECHVTFTNTANSEWINDSSRKARKVKNHLELAKHSAQIFDKDPLASHALFLEPEDFTVITSGYSGMPRNANDLSSRFQGKERFVWVESATRNAIYNLVRPLLKGSTLIVTLTSCVECARAVISVGSSAICYLQPTPEQLERWGSSFQSAITMMNELGIEDIPLSLDTLYDEIEP